MKITDIEVSHHRLPLDPPFVASWDPRARTHFDVTIVRVLTDAGLVGVGSGDAMPGFTGHEDLFVGHDPLAVARHARIIDNLSFHYGRCWPLEVALWDLAGKAAGLPCWKLLGGRQSSLPLYASTGALKPVEAMVETALDIQSLGFPGMKIRFHRPTVRDDLAVVEAIRAAVGDDLALMVDANQAWRMPWDAAPPWRLKDALAVARALADLDVYWLEEPLHRADLDGLAALRQAVPIRIAGGEMARELHDLHAMIRAGAVDVLQPDAVLVGGIGGLAEIARAADAAGIGFTPHTWGNGIGLMANAQLCGGIGVSGFLEYPYDPPTWTPERRDFPLTDPIQAVGGYLTLPDAPGLGIALDEGRLAATRIR